MSEQEDGDKVIYTVAVIPCYNEEQNIAAVVLNANYFVTAVIVVDDYSSDATAYVAKKSGAIVIQHPNRRGVGTSTRLGMKEVLLRGYDIVVILDGDGQHSPNDIPELLKPIIDRKADMVIGTRFVDGSMSNIPPYRRFGIKAITWLYNVGSKQKLSDTQCGFRAFSRDAVRKINITETGFSFSVETLVKARKMGFRIHEVPVSVIYHRQFSQNSSLNPVVHGLGVAFGVIKWRCKVELLGRS